MHLKKQLFFWLVSITACTLFIWLFHPILLPFAGGIAIAYLLNPLVLKLGKFKISRLLAAIIILATFIILVCVLLALIIPLFYQELVQLAAVAPEYIDTLWSKVRPLLQAMPVELPDDPLNQQLRDIIKNNISSALKFSSNLFAEILDGGRALVDLLTFLILTPLVSFMLMKDWPALGKWIEDMLPKRQRSTVLDLLARIDRKVAGFIRGQLVVALLLGLIYAISLSVAGLNFGFLIGLCAGALSVIPLFGSIVGMLASVGMAFMQGGSILFILGVAMIFLAGQFLEGNFITPRIMGDSVGLHPLWILFALMAGNALLGIMGMLLAIPVAASMGVLISHGIECYKDSKFYVD